MESEKILGFYASHRGGINGAAAGFIISIFIMKVGLFRTLFIALCCIIGYYIGKRFSNDKDYFKNMLDKILPPGTYR